MEICGIKSSQLLRTLAFLMTGFISLLLLVSGGVLHASSEMPFTDVRYHVEPPESDDVQWAYGPFSTKNHSIGGVEQFGIAIEGTLYRTNWNVTLTYPPGRVLVRPVKGEEETGIQKVTLYIPIKNRYTPVKVMFRHPNGSFYEQKFSLVAEYNPTSIWEKSIEANSWIGQYQDQRIVGTNGTDISGNTFTLGAKLRFYNSLAPPVRNFGASVDGSIRYTTAIQGIGIPLTYTAQFEAIFRKLAEIGKEKEWVIQPFGAVQTETLSIATSRISADSNGEIWQLRNFTFIWSKLGVSFRRKGEKKWWDLRSSFSYGLLAVSGLSVEGGVYKHRGWKAQLSASTSLKKGFFATAEASYLSLTGDSTVTGITGGMGLGYSF